jgi:hypothetical protein
MILATFLLSSVSVYAQEKSDYPELQVTPRASERLAMESEYEKVKPWTFQSPISYSAM